MPYSQDVERTLLRHVLLRILPLFEYTQRRVDDVTRGIATGGFDHATAISALEMDLTRDSCE